MSREWLAAVLLTLGILDSVFAAVGGAVVAGVDCTARVFCALCSASARACCCMYACRAETVIACVEVLLLGCLGEVLGDEDESGCCCACD